MLCYQVLKIGSLALLLINIRLAWLSQFVLESKVDCCIYDDSWVGSNTPVRTSPIIHHPVYIHVG